MQQNQVVAMTVIIILILLAINMPKKEIVMKKMATGSPNWPTGCGYITNVVPYDSRPTVYNDANAWISIDINSDGIKEKFGRKTSAISATNVGTILVQDYNSYGDDIRLHTGSTYGCDVGGCVIMDDTSGYTIMLRDYGAAINAITECICTPNCAGKQCGNDGCGGSCGTCTSPYICNSSQQCTPPCTPSCTGKQCGSDGCGGSCGTCASGVCSASQICVVCNSNADCPADTYTGNQLCDYGNVVKKYVDYICNLPGTAQSSCLSAISYPIISTCSYACSNGYCISDISEMSFADFVVGIKDEFINCPSCDMTLPIFYGNSWLGDIGNIILSSSGAIDEGIQYNFAQKFTLSSPKTIKRIDVKLDSSASSGSTEFAILDYNMVNIGGSSYSIPDEISQKKFSIKLTNPLPLDAENMFRVNINNDLSSGNYLFLVQTIYQFEHVVPYTISSSVPGEFYRYERMANGTSYWVQQPNNDAIFKIWGS